MKSVCRSRLCRFVLAFICITLLAGCSGPYRSGDFIGKTSAQILEEYGPFDCIVGTVDPRDGLYKNGRCGYTIREARPGFLDRTEESLFFISFDENGTATHCSRGCRPGG